MSKWLAILIVFAAAAIGQTPTGPKQFDVVSIKPNTAAENEFAYRGFPGGTLKATGVTLKLLMMEAYNVKAFQVSGGPGWIDTERFDIEGKVEGVQGYLSAAQHGTMVRAMLEDRFRLKIRRDSREMEVFALMVGKDGSTPHVGNPPGPGQGFRSGPGMLNVKNGSVAMLASFLERQLWRTVIDQTGLTGKYNFALTWTPEPVGHYPGEALGLPPPLDAPPPPATNGPSIFTAAKEQLGLRLDSQKGPVAMIVIERVARPSAN